jgi:hypothetical protein
MGDKFFEVWVYLKCALASCGWLCTTLLRRLVREVLEVRPEWGQSRNEVGAARRN